METSKKVVTSRTEWTGWDARIWPYADYLFMAQEYARQGFSVHYWTGEDRDGNPLAVTWITYLAGSLKEVYEAASL